MESKLRNQTIDWQEVMGRIEAGDSQSSIAETLGLSRNQFAYRMRKYVKQSQQGSQEIAATTNESTTQAKPKQETSFHAKEDAFLMDDSLLDESWSRSWQQNRLVLMVKEPTTVFAYWEVNDLRKKLICEHFQSAWSGLSFFLQVYDVTDIKFNGYNASNTFRISVHHLTESWYITGLTPGRRYQADFGTTTLHGRFFSILRSNIVETPPQMQDGFCEPIARFGTLHEVDAAEVATEIATEITSEAFVQASWTDRFDGYHLVEGKRGKR